MPSLNIRDLRVKCTPLELRSLVEKEVTLPYFVYLHSVGVDFDGQDRDKGWISFSRRFSGRGG